MSNAIDLLEISRHSLYITNIVEKHYCEIKKILYQISIRVHDLSDQLNAIGMVLPDEVLNIFIGIEKRIISLTDNVENENIRILSTRRYRRMDRDKIVNKLGSNYDSFQQKYSKLLSNVFDNIDNNRVFVGDADVNREIHETLIYQESEIMRIVNEMYAEIQNVYYVLIDGYI